MSAKFNLCNLVQTKSSSISKLSLNSPLDPSVDFYAWKEDHGYDSTSARTSSQR